MDLDDSELDPDLARVASGLSGLAVDPSADSRRRILVAVHAARISSEPALRSGTARAWANRPLRLGGIAVLMSFATIATGAGAVAASAKALPGSPAHGLRLAGEDLSLALAPSSGKARLHERFVRDRLAQAAEAMRRGEKIVAAELLSESRRYLKDFNQEIGQLPESQRPAAQGQLHQLETDTQESGQQGPATNTPPAGGSPGSSPQGNEGGGATEPGAPAGQPVGGDGAQSSPGANDGSTAPSAPGGPQDSSP